MNQWVKINDRLMTVLKALILAYVITGVFLLLLALLLYKAGIGESVVSFGVTLIYILTTFVSGFYLGKKMKTSKFLWGLLAGVAYFVILAAISILAGGAPEGGFGHFITTCLLCAGSGMLGGMVS